MHVVFFNPRAQKAHRRLPLSVLFVARALPERHTWELVDANVEPDAERRLAAAVARDPGRTALLTTVMPGPQLRQATPWCRALKTRHPALTVVWGGYFPSIHADACLRDPAVDYVVTGQGEEAAVALLDALDAGRDGAGLPGVAAWRGGAVLQGPSRPYQRPSTFPDVPYERLDMDRYAARTFLGRRTFNHHSSAGCPYVCNFCAVTNLFEGRWLPDPAEHVAGVARLLHDRYGADALEFHDNNFFVSERRCRSFADAISDLRMRWWGEGRIDTMVRWSGETWQSLARSGLTMVFYGAESGDQNALDAMDKGGLKVEHTVELNRLARAHGVVPEFSFVLGNPADPQGDIDRSLTLIRRLKDDNPACEIILYLYTPVPLPGMFDEARAQGFALPTTLDEWLSPRWSHYENRRDPGTPWLTRAMVRQVFDFEAVLHARWPSVSDRNLQRWQRAALRALAAPRYRAGVYAFPVGLKALQRLWHYRRPEEMGF